MKATVLHSKSVVTVAIILMLFMLFGANALNGQMPKPQTLEQDNSMFPWKLQSKTAEEITRIDPAISMDLLKEDGRVIQGAYPQVLTAFEKEGFAKTDVDQIVAFTWKDYRNNHPSRKLDSSQFVKEASENFGGLRVSSKPRGAEVYVDGRKWPDPTDCSGVTHSGRRKIILRKEGYKDVDDYVDVIAGKWTAFNRELQKK